MRTKTLLKDAAEAFSFDFGAGAKRIFCVKQEGAATFGAHFGFKECLLKIETFLCSATLGDSGPNTQDGARWGLIEQVTIRLPLQFLKACTLIDAPGFDSERNAWRNRMTVDCMRQPGIGTVVHVVEDRHLTSESRRAIEKAQIPQRLASDCIKALVLCWPVDKYVQYHTDTATAKLEELIGKQSHNLASIADWKTWMTLQTGDKRWLDDRKCQINTYYDDPRGRDGFSVNDTLRKRLEQAALSRLSCECVTKCKALIRDSLGPYVSLQRIFLSLSELRECEIDSCASELEGVLKIMASKLKRGEVSENILLPIEAPVLNEATRQPSYSSGFSWIAYGLNYTEITKWAQNLLDTSKRSDVIASDSGEYPSDITELSLSGLIALATTNSTSFYKQRKEAFEALCLEERKRKEKDSPHAEREEKDSPHAKCFQNNYALGKALRRFVPCTSARKVSPLDKADGLQPRSVFDAAPCGCPRFGRVHQQTEHMATQKVL